MWQKIPPKGHFESARAHPPRRFSSFNIQKRTTCHPVASGRTVPTGTGRPTKGRTNVRRRSIPGNSRVPGMFLARRKHAVSLVLQRHQGCQPLNLWQQHTVPWWQTGQRNQTDATGCDPARTVGRYAAVRALSHLPEGVQTEEHPAAARLHSHRIATVSVSGMR